jgi:hypothetical protein
MKTEVKNETKEFIPLFQFERKISAGVDRTEFRKWIRANREILLKDNTIEIHWIGKNLRLWYIDKNFDLSRYKEVVK